MVKELLNLYGATDGTSATGTFSLSGDMLYSSVDYIRIPKGMKAKIWIKKLSAEVATTISIEMTHDITATTPWSSPTTLATIRLSSAGETLEDTRRPVIVRGFTGNEAIRVTWSQPTAGNASVELTVELVEDADPPF